MVARYQRCLNGCFPSRPSGLHGWRCSKCDIYEAGESLGESSLGGSHPFHCWLCRRRFCNCSLRWWSPSLSLRDFQGRKHSVHSVFAVCLFCFTEQMLSQKNPPCPHISWKGVCLDQWSWPLTSWLFKNWTIPDYFLMVCMLWGGWVCQPAVQDICPLTWHWKDFSWCFFQKPCNRYSWS